MRSSPRRFAAKKQRPGQRGSAAQRAVAQSFGEGGRSTTPVAAKPSALKRPGARRDDDDDPVSSRIEKTRGLTTPRTLTEESTSRLNRSIDTFRRAPSTSQCAGKKYQIVKDRTSGEKS